MQLLPTVTAQTALFLDFDGTLADLAPNPDAVRIPLGLVPMLATLYERLDGALAIITGRAITDVDHFLAPLALPAAGEHGAQYRLPSGQPVAMPALDLTPAISAMEWLAAQHHGLLVERKSRSVALHYRHAPDLGRLCEAALQEVVARMQGVELLHGKYVLEVKSASVNKGQAIEAFMTTAPFAGRTPIFAGDDVTDEAGFAVVTRLGGRGIKVGEGPTLAEHRCLSPASLRGWLASARTSLLSPP
ncbi:trehalose-phosphatase [Xylophilus sp. GW821-FHT01B05]